MRSLQLCVLVFAFVLAGAARGQDLTQGDVWRWIPFEGKTDAKDAQIVRNTEYISIKLETVYAYYKSGFLENVRQIVVSSQVAFDLGDKKVEGSMVNRTWQKSRNSGDFIPVNDLLAVLSPATPTSIKIKVDFAGIGEDRFKAIFDILSNPDLKTALNLSPAAVAKAGLVTSILQKFLATPYTSSKPKEILSMGQGFVIRPTKDVDQPDSLREGYLVVMSGNENKGNDLTRIQSLPMGDIRFNRDNHALEVKKTDGSWQQFSGNSYVVLSVTRDVVKGSDEHSPWFQKFAEAVKVTDRLLTGDPLDKVKKEALQLWGEGSTLLTADGNYIEAERRTLRLKAFKDIEDGLKGKPGVTPDQARLGPDVPGVPLNYGQIVSDYQSELDHANLSGNLIVYVRGTSGKGLSNIEVSLDRANDPQGPQLTARTNSAGEAAFHNLKPGDYRVRAALPGFFASQVTTVEVPPRETRVLNVQP